MQTLGWEQLLRSVPVQLQNNMSITTKARVEIAVQCLLRIDVECVAVRGRLAGSQDAGRVFFIPYEQIDHIYFMSEMKEAEFHEHFAGLQLPGRAESVPVAATVAAEAVPPPVEIVEDEPVEDLVLAPISPSVAPAARAEVPLKSEVLERFRNRGTQPTGTPRPGKPTSG